jgi:hypothetical protein
MDLGIVGKRERECARRCWGVGVGLPRRRYEKQGRRSGKARVATGGRGQNDFAWLEEGRGESRDMGA